MKPLFLLALFLFLLPLPALAQDNDTLIEGSLGRRDSVDYLMDDGVMSYAEMEDEARHVNALCRASPYQKQYFDCGCLGGAFLIQREKLGPLVSQDRIISSLTTEGGAKCPNTTAVAGEAYNSCLSFNKFHRELSTDGEEFCTCVGRKVATQFSKKPLMSPDYITILQSEAYSFCTDPNNRKYALSGKAP